MSDLLEQAFQKSINNVKQLKSKPSDRILLELYSYYKQATIGNNNTPVPLFLDFKETTKWNAWNKLLNTDRETAKVRYIKIVEKLLHHKSL
jgi:diazepam-binding inhibitor (GABA receptor modulating acyl-CoA-binding protein)